MAASESGGGFTGPLGRQRFQFGEILGGLRHREGILGRGGEERTEHQVGYTAVPEQRARCLWLGMFIQDNVSDLKQMIEDEEEWRESSPEYKNLHTTIDSRFHYLLDVIDRETPACGGSAGIVETIQEAAKRWFYDHDSITATDLLQALEAREGNVITMPSPPPI